MIEIYLLEQLDAFSACGTLSEAAERLNTTQPSLSRSMQKLEGILGVSLFERQKNKITLNETGKLAAEYAKRILEDEKEMERHIRAFDRSLRALTIGSCAPGPLMELLPRAAAVYTDLTVSSAINTEEHLIKGLQNDEYGIILLTHPIESEQFYSQKYLDEQLFLSVNLLHPAASYRQISFSDMDGQNFIMYAQVGFWEELVRHKMPNSNFFKQDSMDAVGELAKYSDLPSFSSDVSLRALPSRQNDRLNIPFSDPESTVTYYCICKAVNRPKWKRLLQNI